MRSNRTLDQQSWDSELARTLIRAGDFGGLIRWSRVTQHGWSQGELGSRTGYSAATVSRVEHTAEISDLAMVKAFASALKMPAAVVAAVLRISDERPPTSPRVDMAQQPQPEDDSMLRRTLLAGGLMIPAALLIGVDDALAAVPGWTVDDAPAKSPGLATDDTGKASDVRTLLGASRKDFDKGAYGNVLEALPGLFAAGHAPISAGKATPLDFAILAACYDLATDAMSKVGAYETGRVTADRSMLYADLSGSPLVAASSARMLSIVLRHRGEATRAAKLTLDAADKVQGTGLKTSRQAAMYAQILASCSYTAAGANDRSSALELITEAERAAARLPSPVLINGTVIGPDQVALYKIGTLWALGDGGAAIDAGRHLVPGMFPTAERRARLHTDRSRAWWLQGRPQQTAEALMQAFRESPEEVRDRPSIRTIVDELDRRHHHVIGVSDLVGAVTAKAA